jgi:hypothetical protein
MSNPDACLANITATAGPDVSTGTARNVAIRLELLKK